MDFIDCEIKDVTVPEVDEVIPYESTWVTWKNSNTLTIDTYEYWNNYSNKVRGVESDSSNKMTLL